MTRRRPVAFLLDCLWDLAAKIMWAADARLYRGGDSGKR